MRLTLITAPVSEPITLDEAMQQCRVRHDKLDARLQQLIRSARQQAEGRTGRALLMQEWEQYSACAPSLIRLRKWPVQSVQSVTVDGQLLQQASYSATVGDNPVLTPAEGVSWHGKEVRVLFTSGYASASDVPQPILDWMLMRLAALYENASGVVVGTNASDLGFVDGLLTDYEVPA